jgi:hypothetical protein
MAIPNPKYDITLKFPDGKKYTFEQATDFAWERYENEPGRCKFSIPSNDPKIDAIATDTQFIQILIYRDQVLIWQGFVAFIQDELNKSTIYGLTFLECLKWYRSGYNVTYTTKKIGSELLSPIWDLIDARAGAILGDLIKKGTFEDPYTTGTSTAKTITKTVMDEDYFTLCQQMVAISRANSPSGAWVQNTVMDISLDEASPTFTFLRDVGVDKPLVVFELDSEIRDYIRTKDFRFIRNDMKGLAVVSGPKVLTSTQTDAASNTAYYLREIGLVFDGATDQTDIDEQSKNFLKESKDPTNDWYVSFTSGLKPFDGYVMGDNVKVRINHCRVALDDFFRVVGVEVTITNEGSEITKPILRRKRT